METSVWQLIVQAVASLLNPSNFLNNQRNQSNGGASQSAPVSDADSTSRSTSATGQPQSLLKLTRGQRTTNGAFGDMVCRDGWECVTLENLALSIPAGLYGLEIYDSPHAGHPVPRLQNVPGRSEIEIHCGNLPGDSKGCILVGSARTGDMIEGSRDAFNVLFPKIQAALQEGPQTIEIVESFQP